MDGRDHVYEDGCNVKGCAKVSQRSCGRTSIRTHKCIMKSPWSVSVENEVPACLAEWTFAGQRVTILDIESRQVGSRKAQGSRAAIQLVL